MSTGRQILTSAGLLVAAAALCAAQSIAPARSGTIHYFDGDVSVDGLKLVAQKGRFTELKEKSVLQTGLGRAEILLTPGVVLRVGENSSVKMLDNRLMSTRVQFLSGIAMVESDESGESIKDPAVTVIYKDFEAQPLRFGLFEMMSSPEQIRVFKGEAKVTGNGASLNVKDGNRINLSTAKLDAEKFDAKDGDDLFVWSRDRSSYLAAGNMSSAHSLADSYNGAAYPGWNPSVWSGFSGGWYYNSNLNMYSYIPFNGIVFSPFGYGLYNPVTIGYAYAPGYYWNGSGGARNTTMNGIPVARLQAVKQPANSSRPVTLPRLNVVSSFHPTMASPLRGSQPAYTLDVPSAGQPNGLFGAAVPDQTPSGASSIAIRAGSAPVGSGASRPTAPPGGGGAAARPAPAGRR